MPTHDFAAATSAFAADGWCVLDDFLTVAQTRDLAAECAALYGANLLTPARIGSGRHSSVLRGDTTRWFVDSELSAPQRVFSRRMDALRQAFSRSLMLGLVEAESHYAHYQPGTGYARHLDRMRDSDARVVSGVFYLNEAWQTSDGGALRLYLADGTYRDIYPRGNTLLLFLSGQFEHEVLPATRNRKSIASWMLRRVLAGGQRIG